MHKLLEPSNYLNATVSQLVTTLDTELLLDFILNVRSIDQTCLPLMKLFSIQLLRNDGLKNRGIEGANRKSRRLVDKLSKKDIEVLPRSLFISDVKADLNPTSAIGLGGFGSVFKGEHKGQPVALKTLYRARNKKVSGTTFALLILICSQRIRTEKPSVEKPSHGGHSCTTLFFLSLEYTKRTHCYSWYRRIWRTEH